MGTVTRPVTQVAVVAVNSIGDADPVDFRNKLFNHWGLGNEEADNGLLVLLVVEQGAIEIETGYGVEGLLPDAICKRIIENLMIPHFSDGDFDRGMIEGVGAMALVLQGADPAEVTEPEEDLAAIAIVAFLFGILIIYCNNFIFYIWIRKIKHLFSFFCNCNLRSCNIVFSCGNTGQNRLKTDNVHINCITIFFCKRVKQFHIHTVGTIIFHIS